VRAPQRWREVEEISPPEHPPELIAQFNSLCLRLVAMAMIVSSMARYDRPSSFYAFALDSRRRLPSSNNWLRTLQSKRPTIRTSQWGSLRWRPLRLIAQTLPQNIRDFAHKDEGVGADVALPYRFGRRHGRYFARCENASLILIFSVVCFQ
jgi:hypothetical protein